MTKATPNAEPMEATEAKPVPMPKDPLAGLVRGRMVLYSPTVSEVRYCGDPGPWAAIVTDTAINGDCTLNVQMPRPAAIGTDPVQRRERVRYDPEGGPETWKWLRQ